MPLRHQNHSHPHGRVPVYYANNRIYPGSYAQGESQTRTSRRIHDGFMLSSNFGLDTTSDDINSSPYSSPYYINGRYNSDNLITQRANSASVQGTKFLLSPLEEAEDFPEGPTTFIELWQGKQIRFTVPYDGKVVGCKLKIRNANECTGILSIYMSASENGMPLSEVSVDLCKISPDTFEEVVLHSMTVVPRMANPKKKLYVRMEIWDEVSQERSINPFNTGRKIEVLANGDGGHDECVYSLDDKSVMAEEVYDYSPMPNRPILPLIYCDYESVPCDRLDDIKTGASASLNGYRYDIFCVKSGGNAQVIVYDKEMNKTISNNIRVDGRITQLNIAQVTDTDKHTWVYYVDGYSPLQRFKIGEWVSSAFATGSADNVTANIDNETWYNSDLGNTSGTYVFTYTNGHWEYNDAQVSLSTYGISLSGGSPSEGSTITVVYTVTSGGTKTIESIEFVDARPVIGASMIMFHNNRLYLAGFRNDPNLVQISAIEETGPNFTQFPYRMYVPNRSPYDTSLNPITAMVEYTSDQIMFAMKNGFSLFQTSSRSGGLEVAMPQQVSTFTDSAGVRAQGDICNYKGVLYSFDQKEGLRRFTGAVWNTLPTTVDSHYDRVDMTKPRRVWGYANKLYFNYTDSVDHRAKCLIWDMQMNYQQYPWFQDVDIPFCDARYDETEDLIGIHPDYPVIMKLYAEDTWARLDTPIVFRRDTKYLSLPGNAADITVKRIHVKVINNANRWWWISVNGDKQNMTQSRGHDKWYRQPVWDTITVKEPVEAPFPFEDVYEENAIYRMSIMDLRLRCSAVQVRVKAKTFRSQCNLASIELEVQPKQML